jgi:NADH-quinone oxidoreductase subunit H
MIESAKDILADQFWFSLILAAVVLGAIMTAVAYSILLERKIAAWMQDRYGPNRVGPFGLFQPIADGLKFLLKEDIIPRNVDRAMFVLAPVALFVVALIGFAVIPWGGTFKWSWMSAESAPLKVQVASIDIGLLYIIAVASLGVYGVVLGGWASNNKYSFYGGMRAAAQMLSYEIPMGLTLLVVVMTTGALRLEGMVAYQSGQWWVIAYHPLVALIFFTTALAESNRMPFDLAESEQELVGGYHTEYSAMKLALFFLAEYAHMITTSALMVCLFLGGWRVPGWAWLNEDPSFTAMVARMAAMGAKIFLLICVYMFIRWTIPRLRFDQLMRLAWKSLVPMSMALVAVQGAIIFYGWSQWYALVGNVAVLLAGGMFSALGGRAITGRQQSLGPAMTGGTPVPPGGTSSPPGEMPAAAGGRTGREAMGHA